MKKIASACAVMALACAGHAGATVLTFEGLAGTAMHDYSSRTSTAAIFNPPHVATIDGFNFKADAALSLVSKNAPSMVSDTGVFPYNPTDFMLIRGVTISSADGAAFGLGGFDLGVWTDTYFTNPTHSTDHITVNFTGTHSDGSVTKATYTIGERSNANTVAGNDYFHVNAGDLAVFQGTNFLDLKSLKLDSSVYVLGLDNLNLGTGVAPPPSTDLPEPGSLALFGAGLAGVMVLRRRKHS